MIEVTATRRCDRCGKDISTTVIETLGNTEAECPPAFTVDLEGRTGSFTDLCDKCRGVLSGLVDRAMLVKQEGA